MTLRLVTACGWFICALSLALPAFAADVEDARNAGCLPKASVIPPYSVCAPCHQDAVQRWATSQYRPCTPYCLSCHAMRLDLERHHPVGVSLPMVPPPAIRLTADKKNACFTCHDMSRPRYDSVRWKSTSLFDRLFRKESRYKTYFLLMRNDEGQLCQNCH